MNTGIYAYLAARGQLPSIMGGLPAAPQVPALTAGMIPQFGKTGKGPLTAQQPLPPKGRGFLGAIDDIFGGPDMQNLTPAQQKAARTRGLLAFGAQMLTATDPRGNRAQGLASLGQGVMAGQAGYGQGIEQGMAANQERKRKAMYGALMPQPNESTEQRYNRYLEMFNTALQQGDTEGMKFISQALNTMPKPGENTADVSWQSITDAQGNIVQLNPKTGATRPVLGTDGKPLKAYRASSLSDSVNWQTTQAADGLLMQVNPRTGATRPVLDANGNPVMGPRRPLTEAEAKNAGFADLAEAAAGAMLDPNLGTPQSPAGRIASEFPIIGNAFVSASDQERRQLAQQFINAILRRESGAAIPDSEYPKYERQYIPTYGDSPEVLARKARARALAVAGLRRSGGRAFPAASAGVMDDFGSMDAAAEGR